MNKELNIEEFYELARFAFAVVLVGGFVVCLPTIIDSSCITYTNLKHGFNNFIFDFYHIITTRINYDSEEDDDEDDNTSQSSLLSLSSRVESETSVKELRVSPATAYESLPLIDESCRKDPETSRSPSPFAEYESRKIGDNEETESINQNQHDITRMCEDIAYLNEEITYLREDLTDTDKTQLDVIGDLRDLRKDFETSDDVMISIVKEMSELNDSSKREYTHSIESINETRTVLNSLQRRFKKKTKSIKSELSQLKEQYSEMVKELAKQREDIDRLSINADMAHNKADLNSDIIDGIEDYLIRNDDMLDHIRSQIKLQAEKFLDISVDGGEKTVLTKQTPTHNPFRRQLTKES